LAETDLDITLYSRRRPGVPVSTESGDSFTLRWLPWFDWQHFAPGRGLSLVREVYENLIRDIPQFDLVHLHGLWNPVVTLAAAACRQVGVPYVISPRGMLQEVSLRHKQLRKAAFYHAWERRTINGASALHFLSPEERDSSRRLPIATTKLTIPNGVKPNLSSRVKRGAFRAAFGLEHHRLVLFVGRIHWSKGLDLQLDSFTRLTTQYPDSKLVLVGPDDGDWPRFQELAVKAGVADRILWTGMRSHEFCLEALADADVFVLTSRHEAHSMAMTEALAIGTPSVLTTTAGGSEVAAAGAAVVTAPEGEALAKAIDAILANPTRADSLRATARAYAAAKYEWPSVAAAMITGYSALLEGHQATAQRRRPEPETNSRKLYNTFEY
jgi:glycosyltransferase involved in cell wall biosynthesis